MTLSPTAAHSLIVRGLRTGLPVRLVAAVHDTSAAMVEKHYGAFIVDAMEDLLRRAVLALARMHYRYSDGPDRAVTIVTAAGRAGDRPSCWRRRSFGAGRRVIGCNGRKEAVEGLAGGCLFQPRERT